MFEGKTAVVTGAGKGLGQAMAVALARAGAKLIGVDIGDMTETSRIIEEKWRNIYSSERRFKQNRPDSGAGKKLEGIYGKVDILVNNAGVIYRSPAEEYPEDGFDFVMNLKCESFVSSYQGNRRLHEAARLGQNYQCMLHSVYAGRKRRICLCSEQNMR